VTTKPAAKDCRPTFTLQLRPEPGVDPVLALRALLKITLRRFGLRCISHSKTARERKMRDQTLSESFALELLREGKLLMRMHTINGMRWFIVPGGQVAESVVERILARPDVQPHDNGLFPGCEQTFRLRGNRHTAQT